MWVLSAALIGLLMGGALSVLVMPAYTANTQLFVAIQNSGSVQELQQGNTFSQARVQSYVKTIETPIVLQPVIEALGLDTSPSDLASKVQGSTDPNTVLINISAVDESPVQAAAIARATADSLIEAVDKLEKPQGTGTSPVSLSIVTPATAPSAPSSPNARLNLAIGLFLGLGVGFVVALLRSTLDNRIRGEAELRRVTDAPLLGAIAFEQDAKKNPLLTQAPSQSPRAECFRQLRTNLKFANISGQADTVLVTSSLPGEGKSTTAANLAIALSQAGQTVCLIDADLRRPMVHDYLGLERNAGLTTALVGQADINDLLQPWGDAGLYVLTSGDIPPNPSELLGSEEMKNLVGRLEQAFDTVIIDAPPLLPVADASILVQVVTGVVLLVSAQKTKYQELEKSIGGLELVGANLLGIVLNHLPTGGPDAHSYGYYAESPPATAKRALKKRPTAALAEPRELGANYAHTDEFQKMLHGRPDDRPNPFSG